MSLAKPYATETAHYEEDAFAWSAEQSELLRQRRFDEIDWQNIIEEIEGVGRSERKSIVSNYRLILMHLLKWQFQPERRSRSWRNTINRERRSLGLNEKDNPSLAKRPESLVADAYRVAREDAADETGLELSIFPFECPYSVEQLRDPEFMPESVSEWK